MIRIPRKSEISSPYDGFGPLRPVSGKSFELGESIGETGEILGRKMSSNSSSRSSYGGGAGHRGSNSSSYECLTSSTTTDGLWMKSNDFLDQWNQNEKREATLVCLDNNVRLR